MPAAATAPPAAVTQGPHEAAWNVGGSRIARPEAATTTRPNPSTRGRPDDLRAHRQATGTSATEAMAATIDQRAVGTQAPNRRSPAPVLVHGAIDALPNTAELVRIWS